MGLMLAVAAGGAGQVGDGRRPPPRAPRPGRRARRPRARAAASATRSSSRRSGARTRGARRSSAALPGGVVVLVGGCPRGTDVSLPTGPIHYDELELRGVVSPLPRRGRPGAGAARRRHGRLASCCVGETISLEQLPGALATAPAARRASGWWTRGAARRFAAARDGALRRRARPRGVRRHSRSPFSWSQPAREIIPRWRAKCMTDSISCSGSLELPGHEAGADAGRLQRLEVGEHRQNRLDRDVGWAVIHGPSDRSERRQLERSLDASRRLALGAGSRYSTILRESQIACPSITSTGTRRWSVSASTSGRRERRWGTRTSWKATPSRRSARATLPHGHSQSVGVVQRYRVAIGVQPSPDAPKHAAGHPQRAAAGASRARASARCRARGTRRSSPRARPRAATSSSPAHGGLVVGKRPVQRGGTDLDRGRHRRARRVLGRGRERERDLHRQLHRRRLDARQPAQVGEQPVQREVAVAEDVALPDLPALVGEHMPARDVVHADDVQRAVDVRRDLAAHEALDEHGRRPPRVAGAEHVRRVDDHDRQPAREQPQRHDLGLVLGVDVRDRRSGRRPTRCSRRRCRLRAPVPPRRPTTCRPAAARRPAAPPPARSSCPRGSARTSALGSAAGSSCPRCGTRARRRASPGGPRGDRTCRPQRSHPEIRRAIRGPSCGRTATTTSSPRATSSRVTCEPMKPVAPVTRV